MTMLHEPMAEHEDTREQKSMERNMHESSSFVDEDRNTTEESGNDEVKGSNERSGASSSNSSAASVFQGFTVFRDFFLAAFSDGYNATFCGSDDVPNCCKGTKIAPYDSSIKSTKSTGASFDGSSVQQSVSQQDGKRRRKKPLAVAVGFNYAEDYNGRPIIVTPTGGSRNSPIDLTNVTSVRVSPSKGSAPPLPTLNVQSSSPPQTTSAPSVPALRSRPQHRFAQEGTMPY